MDTDDYRDLIGLVERELREVGAGALADPNHYAERDPKTGEQRLYSPRKHLIEMLRAFSRHLAIYDRATFDSALGRINEVVNEGRIEDAIFIPISEEGEGEPRSLRIAPELGAVREAVERLIEQLSEERDLPRETE